LMRIGQYVKVCRIGTLKGRKNMAITIDEKDIRIPLTRPSNTILGSVGQIIRKYEEEKAYLVKFLFMFPNFTTVEGNYLIFDSEVVRPQDWEIREYKKWERTALARKVAKKL